MPRPARGATENFWPGCTTTYLPLPAPKVLCNSTKSRFKSENLPLVSVRTNLPASSTFLALWLRKFAYFWCCHIKSYLKIFIQVHIYKIYACAHLHLVSEMIYYVSSGTFNPTHSLTHSIMMSGNMVKLSALHVCYVCQMFSRMWTSGKKFTTVLLRTCFLFQLRLTLSPGLTDLWFFGLCVRTRWFPLSSSSLSTKWVRSLLSRRPSTCRVHLPTRLAVLRSSLSCRPALIRWWRCSSSLKTKDLVWRRRLSHLVKDRYSKLSDFWLDVLTVAQ